MIAPGADGVEVGGELCLQLGGKLRGEGRTRDFGWVGVGEVLEHGEGDEEGVAWGPGSGLVAQDAELDGEVVGLLRDGGVDADGEALEHVLLIGWKDGDGVIGGGADLQGALEAVVREERGTEDFGEFAGGVAAEQIHLEETVGCGDEALGDEEVVDRLGVDVGDAVLVAFDGDGGGESGELQGAVYLRQGGAGAVAQPCARAEEGSRAEDAEGEENDEGELDEALG